jgi:hypothetical protein
LNIHRLSNPVRFPFKAFFIEVGDCANGLNSSTVAIILEVSLPTLAVFIDVKPLRITTGPGWIVAPNAALSPQSHLVWPLLG